MLIDRQVQGAAAAARALERESQAFANVLLLGGELRLGLPPGLVCKDHLGFRVGV